MLQRAVPFVNKILYSVGVLGNLAKKTEIEDLRVPHSQSFVIDISVGTPPQKLRCLLDTGFADVWLPAEHCEACGGSSQHFRRERSSTFAPSSRNASNHSGSETAGNLVKVPFNRGKLVGLLGHDTVNLGSGTFENQSFLLVPQANLPQNRAWDGVCGLGRFQIATHEEPLWKRLPAASHGGHASFALVPGHGKLHYFVAGEVPYSACKEGTLAWADVEPLQPGGARKFWVISGGLAIHHKNPVNSRFLLDTGTSFLLAPPKKYFPFVRSLFAMDVFDRLCGVDPSAGNVVVCNCSIMQEAPNMLPVRVYVGGHAFALEIPDLFARVPAGDGSEMCLLQIQKNSAGSLDPLDLLGDILGGRVPAGRQGAAAQSVATRTLLSKGPVSIVPEGRLSDDSLDQGDERTEDVLVRTRRLEAAEPGTLPRAGSNDTVLGPSWYDLEENLWVIGGVFIERFVLVLDFENQRVGVAEPDGKVLLPQHQMEKGVNVSTKPAQDMQLKLRVLQGENANLRAKLMALERSEAESRLVRVEQQKRQSDLTAELKELEHRNAALSSELLSMRRSQEESKAQYIEVQEEAVQRMDQWNSMHADIQDLRLQNQALLRRGQQLLDENRGLRLGETRMQLLVLGLCCVTVFLGSVAVLGTSKACGLRSCGLLLLRGGALDGSKGGREVRDVAPLLLDARPGAASPAAKADAAAEVLVE